MPVWQDAFTLVDPGIDAEAVHAWPFDPGFPLDVVYVTCHTGRQIRLNRHDYFEVLVVRSGELTAEIQARSTRLRPNDIMLMGSTHYHGLRAGRGSSRAMALFFRRELLCANWTDENVELLKPFLLEQASESCIIRNRPLVARAICDAMDQIHGLLPARSPRQRVLARTHLEAILARLVEHFGAALDGISPGSGLADIERLRPLFAQMDRDLAEPITLEEAATLVGMSRTSFIRWFRRVTGQSFRIYLERLRITRAQHLLLNTDWTLAAIAQGVGFSEQSYFGRVFRRLVGATPREYRRTGE